MSETKILLRRDSATNWFSSNPVLSSGELGYCTDTRQIKIGNGVSRWNDLSFTYNPISEGSAPYSVVLTSHFFTASSGAANVGKTDITVRGLYPNNTPTNTGISAFLYVSTGASSRRLLRKTLITLDGYAVNIGFSNMVSTDIVYLGNYTVEILGETQTLIGRYTFTYRPVLNPLKLDLFILTERTAKIHIYNPTSIAAGSLVRIRRRSDLSPVGSVVPTESLSAVTGTNYNIVNYTITNTQTFLNNIDYFCEINYDIVNDLYANSEVVRCSIQNIPPVNVSFDPDDIKKIKFKVVDGTIKILALSIFLCNVSGDIISLDPLGTIPIPLGGLLPDTIYTINLRRVLIHEEYYLFQYLYSVNGTEYNSPPIQFIQHVTLNNITITSDTSISTNIDFEGSYYNLVVTATDTTTEDVPLGQISGPVSIFKDTVEPIATYTGTVLNNANLFFNPVVYTTPKPFYSIAFSPFIPYAKDLLTVTTDNINLMLTALNEAIKLSYRLRIYAYNNLLQLILETIHTHKTQYPELTKLRIVAAVNPDAMPAIIYGYSWRTELEDTTLTNLRNRLFTPLLKFGTENIIGVCVGNETIHFECNAAITSNIRKNYLFNSFISIFNKIRQFLINPPYDATRLPGTAIKMIPVGICETPGEVSFMSKFGQTNMDTIIKFSDFVMVNLHPFYGVRDYNDDNGYGVTSSIGFLSQLITSQNYISSLSPPDNPCHYIVGEWGWPTGWEWPVIKTATGPTGPTGPTNINDYSTYDVVSDRDYTGILTPAIQRDWIVRVLEKHQSRHRWSSTGPTGPGTAPTNPVDMVFFAFNDNHSQEVKKGSYVRSWGVYRLDIQSIETETGTRIQQAHNVNPSDTTTFLDIPGNPDATTSEIAAYNRRTKYTSKHQEDFEITKILNDNNIPLHITDTNDDLIFRTEYPEITISSLPGITSFLPGRSYNFTIKAGGYSDNVTYLTDTTIPYNGVDVFISSLKFVNLNSIKVVGVAAKILSNLKFDIIDISNPTNVIGTITTPSVVKGSISIVVPTTGASIPPTQPTSVSDGIPIVDPTSTNRYSVTMPALVPAVAASRFEYGKSYAVRVSYTGGVTFTTEPIIFESQIASFGYGGNDKVKIDILWFDQEKRALTNIPIDQLPLESTLSTDGTTATPAFFANIKSADISLYKYTGTFNTDPINRLAPSLTNYVIDPTIDGNTETVFTIEDPDEPSTNYKTTSYSLSKYYGTSIFIKVLYKAAVPAKRLVSGVMSKTTVYQSLTVVATLKKRMQFENPNVSNVYINVLKTLIFGTLSINKEDGPDLKYGATDFTEIIPKLVTTDDPPVVLSSSTLISGKYRLTTTPLNLVNNTEYAIAFYARRQVTGGVYDVLIASQPYRYVDYSDISFSFVFIDDQTLKVIARFPTYYTTRKRIKLELYGSSTSDITSQAVSLVSECRFPAFYISDGSTYQEVKLKDPYTFKIGRYYSVRTTIFAYDDGSYSDTVVSTNPTTNSYLNRFIYNRCQLTPTTNIYSGLVTVSILWSTYLGEDVIAYMNINSDQDVTYVRKRIVLDGTGFLSNRTYEINITAADITYPFVPTNNYYVYLEFDNDYVTPNFTFQYNPITLNILSSTSRLSGNTKTNTFELDWGGPSGVESAKASVVLKSDQTTVSSELDVNSSTLTCSFSANYTTSNQYTLKVVYGTRTLVSYDFFYSQVVTSATNIKFIDDLGDFISDDIGYLTADISLTGLPPHTELKFELYEFSNASSQLDGVLITNKTVSHTPATYSSTITFKTQYFRIDKYYNVKYSAGDFLFSNNIIYSPKGYDIIVIAGASNQVGQDTDSTRGDYAGYAIQRERGGYPQLTTVESTSPLIDKNNNIVKIYNFQGGGLYTTNALTNENIPSLHRAIAPFQQFSSNSVGSPYGITAGYEFAKYYASSNLLKSNRRVAVINEAIPASAFLLNPAKGTGLSWNATSGGYTGDYYNNIKTAIKSISIRNTYSNIVPNRNKLTHANIGKSPKLGCKISLASSMSYSQDIVNNFQYCYFVDDTMLNSIHPIQGNILSGFTSLPSTSDASIRTYIKNELKSLQGTTVAGHPRFPFETGYSPLATEYKFDAFKDVMNFIVENELTLRINGLVGPDSTGWLTTLSRSNAIYAIMRHCYTVVKWFNGNYPGIVFAYDVIRNHVTRDADNAGVYDNPYAKSNTDTLYAEAAFIGAYAALLNTQSTSDLSWTESLVDNVSVRFPYKAGSIYGSDTYTIIFQSILQTILSSYISFPINGISIQGKYNIGDFIIDPQDTLFSPTSGSDSTVAADTLFNGTSAFDQGTYGSNISLLKTDDPSDSRYIQGVTLLERITAFNKDKISIPAGYGPFQTTLPVTITETQFNVSQARLGNPITGTSVYWGGATYPAFRTLQLKYLKTLYQLIDNSDLNINKDYIGFGELISNPESEDLSSFFLSGAGPSTKTETSVLNDFITFISSYPTTNSKYSANRVVAFLWNQGEENRPAFDNNETYQSNLTSLINGLVISSDLKSARLDDTVYLIGNLSYEHTARAMIKASATINSYGIHDNIDNFAVLSRTVQPITSLGLHCIDPNIPTSVNIPLSTASFPTISFSARSQRLLGARYFNGYLANTGNTSPTSYPIYRVESSSSSIPTVYDFDLQSKILTFINKASSYDYTKHPVAYIIQTRFYKPTGGFDSPDTDRYAIITEYSSTNKSSTSDTLSPTLAVIPYFDMNSANIVTNDSNISLATYSITGDSVSSKITFVNNVIKASYLYDTPEVFTNDLAGNINGINTKTLRSDLTSYLNTVSSDYTANSYTGSISIIGTVVRNVLGGGSTFSIRYGGYNRTSPYTFVETHNIDILTSVSSSSVENSANGTTFIPLNTSSYVPNVVRSFYVNGILYVGFHSAQFLSGGSDATPAGASLIYGSTFGIASPQVDLTSSTASTTILRTAIGQDIQGTTRISGLTATALTGIFSNEGTWGTTAAASASPSDYSVAGNGRLYTIATKGLDWIMFISRTRFYTQRILTNTNTPRVSTTNLYITSAIPQTISTPFYYPCATASSQFAGISRIPLSNNNKLLPISGSYTPTFKYFMFLFNAETSIIFRLNNLTNATYTLSFYFSVKNGRVPHEDTYSTSPVPTSLTTTSTLDTGASPYTYPALYEIYDPLPINIFYSNPTTGASRSADFTYNLRFTRGTNNANTLFLHGNNKWDGSWRSVSLTFTIPASTTLANGNCYVQLGPLPYRNLIDTSFNFGGFSTKIVNT